MMGQYAVYILGSYGFTIFMLGVLAWYSLRRLAYYRAQIAALDSEAAKAKDSAQNLSQNDNAPK